MARKYFSNTAVATTLSVTISDADTSLTVNSSTGYPTVPFTIAVNAGTSAEEIILVGAKSGTTFSSLTRGYDGSTARSHTSGATVKHVAAAEDFDALYTHDHDTADGHTNIPFANVTGTVPTTQGGTGLTSLGTAGQVIKVNSGGTAFEFGNVEAVLNIEGMTDGSAITIADTDKFIISDDGVEKFVTGATLKTFLLNNIDIDSLTDGSAITLDATDKLAVSDAGTEKFINISQIKTFVNSDLQELTEDYVNGLLVEGSNITLTYDDGAGTLTIAASNTQLSQEQVEDYVNGLLVAGSNITLTYNDVAGTLTIDAAQLTQEQVEDYVNGLVVAGSNMTITYDDVANTLTFASTDTQLTQEQVEDYVAGLVTAGTDISVTYDDAAGTLTIANTAALSAEQVEDIVGAMVSGNSETGITVTYDDINGKLDFSVAIPASDEIVDADADTKIQVEETADEDIIRFDTAGVERATMSTTLALTTNGGGYVHNQTQASTYTINTGEGAVFAGPVTITGTVTNNGTMVIV